MSINRLERRLQFDIPRIKRLAEEGCEIELMPGANKIRDVVIADGKRTAILACEGMLKDIPVAEPGASAIQAVLSNRWVYDPGLRNNVSDLLQIVSAAKLSGYGIMLLR